jgi:large subunit ribosomal protein L25
MKETVLAVESRKELGKNASRRLRREGKVPAVVYGAGEPPLSVAVDPRSLRAVLTSATGANTLCLLELDGKRDGKTHMLIHDVQYDPITDRPIHVDLTRVSMTQEIRVKVPVELLGTARGVKLDGGILDFITREVEVLCLPADIPDHIRIDVSDLGIGNAVRVADLPLGAGYRIVSEPDRPVAVVAAPVEEKAEAAVPAAEITEPELIRKGKEEPEEGAEEAPSASAKREKEKEKE